MAKSKQPITVLSQADITLLKKMADAFRKDPQGTVEETLDGIQVQSPETYIALIPESGIPARSDLVPGYAECDLYRMNDGVLSSMGAVRKVYNLTLSAIATGYMPITRIKGGQWVTSVGGGVANSVAYTTQVIPGRVGDVPGGPIWVTKKILRFAGTATASSTSTTLFDATLVDGDGCYVWSWATSDSLSNVYIFIEQDEAGNWWFTGEDCAV